MLNNKKLTIVLLGSGGREHALAWSLSQSPRLQHLHVFPGNPGMQSLPQVTCHGRDLSTDELINFCRDNNVDWVMPASEAWLAQGVVDLLNSHGIKCFGPARRSAMLESSKIFSKLFMQRHQIPTARAHICQHLNRALEAIDHVLALHQRVVVKASGLWAGKGVLVTSDREQAFAFARELWRERPHEGMLIEAPLKGWELSYFVLSDGKSWHTLGMACDHKRLRDGDCGPNTGGMGCFIPEGRPTQDELRLIDERIVAPTMAGLAQEGLRFAGILFFGLMIDGDDINVIEYNVRFGDPETQTILPTIQSDLLEYLDAAVQGQLAELPPLARSGTCVHVVLASKGYAEGEMLLHRPIRVGKLPEGGQLFYAGAMADSQRPGALINSGGRVMGISARAHNLSSARELAYRSIEEIEFEGMQCRRDIAASAAH